MQFQVPQFIESEDKIIGPLTLKQFMYVGGAGGISFLLFMMLRPVFAIGLSAIIVALGIALAFGKVNGVAFPRIFGSMLLFMSKPRLYIWHRSLEEKTVEIPEVEEKSEKEERETKAATKAPKKQPAAAPQAVPTTASEISVTAPPPKRLQNIQQRLAMGLPATDRPEPPPRPEIRPATPEPPQSPPQPTPPQKPPPVAPQQPEPGLNPDPQPEPPAPRDPSIIPLSPNNDTKEPPLQQ